MKLNEIDQGYLKHCLSYGHTMYIYKCVGIGEHVCCLNPKYYSPIHILAFIVKPKKKK